MRFIEISGGLLTPINIEETALVEQIRYSSPVPKSSLSEREQEVARSLTNRGILKRFKIDEELYFKLNLDIKGR